MTLLQYPAQRRPRIAAGGQKGFTLIESMIAMLILIVGLMAVMQLFAVAVLSNKIARSKTFATQAGQAALENLQTQYDLWLKLKAEKKPAPADPFPLTGEREVGWVDPSQANVQQTETQGATQIYDLYGTVHDTFKVGWTAQRVSGTQNVYRVDITVDPGNQTALKIFNTPVRVTAYLAP